MNTKEFIQSLKEDTMEQEISTAAKLYYNSGNDAADKGNYEEAVKNFSEAIRLAPNYANAYFNRGDAFDEAGEYDKAIADYSEVIRIEQSADAYLNRGVVFNKKGEDDLAIADLTEAIRLDPNCDKAYSLRSAIYKSKGEIDRAIADKEIALKLVDPEAYNRIKKEMEERNSGISAEEYVHRGAEAEKQGNYDKAIEYFSEAIRLKPNFSDAYFNRAYTYAHKGEKYKVIADLKMVLQINPDDAEAEKMLNTLLGRSSNNDSKMGKEVKTLLAFAIVGAVIGGILGIAGGGSGFVAGIWFGCGFGCAIEYIRHVSLWDMIKQYGFSKGFETFFKGGLFFLVLFVLGGPIGLLIQYFKVKKEEENGTGN
jgi:tetratricopeptide (TPR) repeat protein